MTSLMRATELEAERVILCAILAQDRSVEKDRVGFLRGAGGEMPDVRREKPRPAEQIAVPDAVDLDRAFAGVGLEDDGAALDKIKPVGGVAFPEDDVARREMCLHRALEQEPELKIVHGEEKRMSANFCL